MPLKITHLEQTGIGITVNSMRRLDGEVADAAKSLIAKWKEMVINEQNSGKVQASQQAVEKGRGGLIKLHYKKANYHKHM